MAGMDNNSSYSAVSRPVIKRAAVLKTEDPEQDDAALRNRREAAIGDDGQVSDGNRGELPFIHIGRSDRSCGFGKSAPGRLLADRSGDGHTG